MKLKLYNMLHQSREVIEVLNEPESIMIRRKELTEQVKIMRNAQKIIRSDPDLMQVMSINISDTEITSTKGKETKTETTKETTSSSSTQSKPASTTSGASTGGSKPASGKTSFGNLFGTKK